MHSHLYFRVMEYVSDLLSVLPPILLAGLVYGLLRRWWLARRGLPRRSWPHEGARLLLVCYLAGLLVLVWTPANFWPKLWQALEHGWPLELGQWLFQGGFSFEVSFPRLVADLLRGGSWQVAGNVALYLPLGALLPLVWPRASWWRIGAVGLALSLVTELIQPVVGRSFDLDDLIANTLGALVGYLVFALARRLAPAAVARCQRGEQKETPAE